MSVIKAEFSASLRQSSESHDPSSFRNHCNMLIYNQCWKPLCCMFLRPVIYFFINKKLKKAFIYQINVVLQYTMLFKSLGSVHFFFIFCK